MREWGKTRESGKLERPLQYDDLSVVASAEAVAGVPGTVYLTREALSRTGTKLHRYGDNGTVRGVIHGAGGERVVFDRLALEAMGVALGVKVVDARVDVAALLAALRPFAEGTRSLADDMCHKGLCAPEDCTRCGKVLAARVVLAKMGVL